METLEFTLHTKESAPQKSKEMLKMAEKQFGFIPNVLLQMAESPTAIQGDLTILDLLSKSSLSVPEQQIVLLVTASYCKADYCVAANSTVAMMMGVSSEIVQNVRKKETLSDPKLEALRIFADEMVRNHGFVSNETKKLFLNAGFNRQNVFDVILGIAVETMASYTAKVADTPLDEQFQSNAVKNKYE